MATISKPLWSARSELLREPNLLIPKKKPIGPVQIDWSNHIADQMVICSLFQSTNLHINLANNSLVTVSSYPSQDTQDGNLGHRFTTSQYLDYGPDPISTTECTIAMIAAHTDTTARDADGFGHVSATTAQYCECLFPYSNGNVYFDFGGSTQDSTRTNFGWTKDTDLHTWVFRAGPSGMSIWLDGVRQNNWHTTPASRSTASGNFRLNYAVNFTNGQNVKYDLFTVSNTEWSDKKIQDWIADPYQFLIPS